MLTGTYVSYERRVCLMTLHPHLHLLDNILWLYPTFLTPLAQTALLSLLTSFRENILIILRAKRTCLLKPIAQMCSQLLMVHYQVTSVDGRRALLATLLYRIHSARPRLERKSTSVFSCSMSNYTIHSGSIPSLLFTA